MENAFPTRQNVVILLREPAAATTGMIATLGGISMFKRVLICLVTGMFLGQATISSALAQVGNLKLELNTAADVDNGCRLTYVVNNDAGTPLLKTSYEVVVFNKAGKVSRFLVLDFGQLPVGKTKVFRFDVAEQACSDISRLLINDLDQCETEAGKADICIAQLKSESRTAIEFGQ